uniref:Uncharacterized protein n=1 Tax=Myripristis murdjan TaxID=586833 RepID=A0A667ZKA7_9TELE
CVFCCLAARSLAQLFSTLPSALPLTAENSLCTSVTLDTMNDPILIKIAQSTFSCLTVFLLRCLKHDGTSGFSSALSVLPSLKIKMHWVERAVVKGAGGVGRSSHQISLII